MDSMAYAAVTNCDTAAWATIRSLVTSTHMYDEDLSYRDLGTFFDSVHSALSGIITSVANTAQSARLALDAAVMATWKSLFIDSEGLSAYLPEWGDSIPGIFTADDFQLLEASLGNDAGLLGAAYLEPA